MKKYISMVLAALMSVSVCSFTALAEDYPENGAYYNDFSSGEVYSTNVVGSGVNAFLVDFSVSNIASKMFEQNAPTSEISNGKLKIKSNGGYYLNSGQNGRTRSVTYIKFDKDFDVSANTAKKLIISYDVALNDFDFYDEKNTSMGNIQRYLFDAGLFEYKDSKTAAEGVFAGGSSSGNTANIGMAFQIPYTNTETNKAEKAGLLIATGNSTPMQSVVGVGHGGSGIFNKPLGNVFHVEYEVTPATETSEPRITKITMSDSEDSTVYNVPENIVAFDIKGKTKVSGIRLDTWRGGSVDIDNVKAYYEPESAPLAAAVNPENVSLKDKLNVKLNCWIDETTADGIVVKNGENVIANADIDITRSAVTYETDIAVTIPSMQYGTTYTVEIPDTLKSDLGETFAYTALNYTTMPLSNVTPQMTVSDGTKTVGSISELAGKYAKCDVSAVSEKNVSALFVVALYDSENKIVSYGAQYADFKADAAEEMTVSFPVPENTDGMSIKAFACESLDKADIKLGATAELK